MANTVDTTTPEEILRKIIDGTLTELEDDGVTAIGERKFQGRTALTRVSFPNFNGSIGNYAFYGCTGLTNVNIQGTSTIGTNAFKNCTNLTTVNIPDASSLGEYALDGCSKLENLDISNVTSIGQYALRGTKVTTVHFKKMKTFGSNSITSSNIEYLVNEGQATGGNYSALNGATKLKILDTGWSGTWSTGSCSNNANMKIIIKRGTGTLNLSNTGLFNGTPWVSGGSGGTYYVLKSRIAAAKSASI